mmetsp:Transcript_18210/g.54932  ORF Transcript_18210/g.54932 Transcript_18210/m.54932 type:complete len:232 (+) Transcript_18210:660-1355(+)
MRVRGGRHSPPVPFALQAAPPIDASLALELVEPFGIEVARKAAYILSRQKAAAYDKLLFRLATCPPWLFVALREHFCRIAGDELSAHITPITSSRGGHGGVHIEDKFVIKSTNIVDKVVGQFNKQGPCALFKWPNNNLVMLMPPLTFKFRTRRDVDRAPTELFVTGHFFGLADGMGSNTPRWMVARHVGGPYYTPEVEHKYKIALANAAVVTMPSGLIPEHVLRWLSVLFV